MHTFHLAFEILKHVFIATFTPFAIGLFTSRFTDIADCLLAKFCRRENPVGDKAGVGASVGLFFQALAPLLLWAFSGATSMPNNMSYLECISATATVAIAAQTALLLTLGTAWGLRVCLDRVLDRAAPVLGLPASYREGRAGAPAAHRLPNNGPQHDPPPPYASNGAPGTA